MKASDFIIEELNKHNINIIFGYIGGMVAHLVDSIYKNPNVEMINTINEQGAGFAAEGYARAANPNIQMFKNLADFVNDSCPMITIGSGAEYDKSKPVVKVKEEEFGKFVPKDPYGYSKYIISKEIEKKEYILNLRVFGIYGFGEDSSRVTGCIINANIKKEPIILNQNVKFSFIWIDDFCKIVEYFLNHKTKEKFLNITPSESIEIVDLAKIVNVFSDYKSEIIVKKSGLNNEYTGDNSKLLNEIGKFDFTSYKDGLKIYYEKQQKNNKLTKS